MLEPSLTTTAPMFSSERLGSAQPQSGLRGTPLHGLGIVGWRCGAGWGLECRAPDCWTSVRISPNSEIPPFGVVAFWQPQVPSMPAGLEVAKVLPEKQSLTEFWVPNT